MKRFACTALLAIGFAFAAGPAFADNTKAFIANSRAAESKGQFDDAAMWLQAVIAADPSRPASYVLLADLYARNGHLKTARAYYNDALFIDPADPKALQGIALADLKLGEADAAQASLDRLAETCGPHCPETQSVREALAQSKKLGPDAASTALDKH